MKDKLPAKLLLAAICLSFASCRKNIVVNTDISPSSNNSSSQILNPTPAPPSDSSIRKVDFENFTYPETNAYSGFTLKDGEKPYIHNEEEGIFLGKIVYADITNDGQEDAILNISIQTGGSLIPNLIYVYTLKNKKPKFLWGFMSGDRAEGGLKSVSAENGELIVETFGDNKFQNGEWEFKFPQKTAGYCCPTAYTKIRLRWNGEKFVTEGEPEVFDYDWKKEIKERQAEGK